MVISDDAAVPTAWRDVRRERTETNRERGLLPILKKESNQCCTMSTNDVS